MEAQYVPGRGHRRHASWGTRPDASPDLKHAELAIREAAQVVLVVDGRAEITGSDSELARLLLRTGKPLALAVNKVDKPNLEAQMQEWYALGIGRVFFVSAEHGTGVAELLDEVIRDFPSGPWGPPASPRKREKSV